MASITHIATRSVKRELVTVSRRLRSPPPLVRSIHGPNSSTLSRTISRGSPRKTQAKKPSQPLESRNPSTQPLTPRSNVANRAAHGTGQVTPIGVSPSFRPGQTQANDTEGQRKQEAYKAASRKWTAVLTALPIFLVTSYYLFDRLILNPPPRLNQTRSVSASKSAGAAGQH